MGAGAIPFRRRLEELLAQRGPDATQAWLANRSGVDRSLISRMLNGERVPTLDTLECLAPALGIDVATLVTGTDAEDRLLDVANHVRKTDYTEAVATLIKYESKNRDLDALVTSLRAERDKELEARRQAERALPEAETARAEAEAHLKEITQRYEEQTAEL
ncbi:MAG: helix-turn-helix transcriptional regulator, partial [Deltaproteobacteria bacterium]|nr:helix-turn-helix transcriptional regulator [Deltaproteobacteria bacterium]